MKCGWSISFIQVGRNRTHPIFQKLYHTNICTSSLYEFAILHTQTSSIIQVASYKSFKTGFINNSFILSIIKKLIKLCYLHCSCKKVVEKANWENLEVIKNALPNKPGNPENIRK